MNKITFDIIGDSGEKIGKLSMSMKEKHSYRGLSKYNENLKLVRKDLVPSVGLARDEFVVFRELIRRAVEKMP